MSNLDTNKPSRESVAKHELIAAAGGEHTDMQSAIGIRYTDKSATDKPFEYIIPGAQPGTPLTMLALFGAKTKATNEASRVRNGLKGTTEEELEALDEVFDSITNGVWREKAEGGGGTRTDKQLLATIIVELLGSRAAGDASTYVKRMEDDATFIRKAMQNDAVKDEYRKRSGRKGVELDALI